MGTLKVRYPSGQWTPILGSGFDAANTMRWNSAWGVIAQATVTANQGPLTAVTPVTGATVTITAVAGRRYRISWESQASFDAADGVALFQLLKDGSMVQQMPWHLRVAAVGGGALIEYHDAPTAGSHTYSISIGRGAGTGNLTMGATATQPSTLTVTDVGPVTQASIAPPSGPSVVAAGNALGVVAIGGPSVSGSSPQPLSSGVQTIVTNPITFTPQVGRRYRLAHSVRALASTALSYVKIDFMQDGVSQYALYGDRYVQVNTSGYTASFVEWLFDGDGVTHNYTIQFNATGTPSWYPNGVLFYIEDVGPNTAPALPLPATYQAWTPVTFQNNWVNIDTSRTAQYRKVGDIVEVRGCVKGGTVAAGTPIFVLPAGFLPTRNQEFVNVASGGVCDVIVETPGRVSVSIIGASAPSTYMFLDNVRFSVTA